MKCRICGRENVAARSVWTRGGEKKKLFHCAACDFDFFSKDFTGLITADHFERERLGSAGLRIPDIKTDFDNGLRQSLEYRKSYVSGRDRGRHALEVGPSWGYFLKVLKSAGVKPVGLEINPVRAEFVRRNLNIPCYERLEEIERRSARFCKIFLFYVIQYIKDPVRYLARLVRLLERKGSIYVITPNHHDPLKDIWNVEEYRRFFYEKMTVSYYSARAAKKLAGVISRDHHISFDVKTKQGYSFINHLMWYFDGKPRTTGVVGGDRYVAAIEKRLSSSPAGLGRRLAGFVREFDFNYRSAIEREDAGNQIILTIRKET